MILGTTSRRAAILQFGGTRGLPRGWRECKSEFLGAPDNLLAAGSAQETPKFVLASRNQQLYKTARGRNRVVRSAVECG